MRHLDPLLHLIAVSHPPERIDAQDSEYVRDSDSHLDIRTVQFAHLLREKHHGLGILRPDDAVVLFPDRAVCRPQGSHFPPLQTLQQRNLPEEESLEVMFPENCDPQVRGKLVVVHAVERIP